MKITKTVAPFGSDMHQIVCWRELCPKPHWGSLQHSYRTPTLFRGWGRQEKGKEGGEGEKERGEGRVTEGRESWQA